MRTAFLFISIFLINSIYGQDYTNEVESESTVEKEVPNVLVVPFQSQFLLSEIDRGLVNASNMGVMEIRSGLRFSIANRIAESYSDSIKSISLADEIQAGNLTYIHHGFSYGFKEIKKEEEKKKFSLKKKEKPEVKSHKTNLKAGQITKKPVFADRYMAAEIKNEEVVEFIQNEFDADIIIILSEFDLMKNKDPEKLNDFTYKASLHYNIIDQEGVILEGSKAVKYFNPSEFNYDRMQESVISVLCDDIHKRSILYLNRTSKPFISEDEDNDY